MYSKKKDLIIVKIKSEKSKFLREIHQKIEFSNECYLQKLMVVGKWYYKSSYEVMSKVFEEKRLSSDFVN